MKRREFLKSLVALPLVGLVVRQVPEWLPTGEAVDFDDGVAEIRGPSWADAPTVTASIQEDSWYLLSAGLNYIDLDGSRPTGVHAEDIINLEVDFGDRMLHAGPLRVERMTVDIDGDSYGEYMRLVPTWGAVARTLSLDQQHGGDWSVTISQGMPKMLVSPFKAPRFLGAFEADNV